MRQALNNMLRATAIMLAVVLLLLGTGCHLHHTDTDRCLNDHKIRYSKKFSS